MYSDSELMPMLKNHVKILIFTAKYSLKASADKVINNTYIFLLAGFGGKRCGSRENNLE
jgi:hypothetical protein